MTEISVFDLRNRRDAGEELVLLDVREDDELETASLPGVTHIPMNEVPEHLTALPHDRAIVVMCHAGGRSARVTKWLNDNGFPNAVNLEGGIDAWSEEIDPTVPRY